ncbi:hypothetical protein B0H12DRAFT_1149871 [Mycena haematopus]|nr:hypothetical protein B0H12DRAFT_1149871 [Mycena haematopus]
MDRAKRRRLSRLHAPGTCYCSPVLARANVVSSLPIHLPSRRFDALARRIRCTTSKLPSNPTFFRPTSNARTPLRSTRLAYRIQRSPSFSFRSCDSASNAFESPCGIPTGDESRSSNPDPRIYRLFVLVRLSRVSSSFAGFPNRSDDLSSTLRRVPLRYAASPLDVVLAISRVARLESTTPAPASPSRLIPTLLQHELAPVPTTLASFATHAVTQIHYRPHNSTRCPEPREPTHRSNERAIARKVPPSHLDAAPPPRLVSSPLAPGALFLPNLLTPTTGILLHPARAATRIRPERRSLASSPANASLERTSSRRAAVRTVERVRARGV